MELKDRAFLFQSTLPARGATPLFFQHLHRHRDFNPRSPHGERPNYVLTLVEACAFQSTLPARGATLLEGNPGKQKLFQSTLPARGATLAADVEGFANLISIHAPRTGSDVFADAHGRITAHFNPRSPHGERHGVLGYSPIAFEFQSTLPARGATAASTVSTSVTRTFQSTLPARGATGGIQHFVPAIAISIHAPRTGSDPSRQWSLARPDISIHAPRTGSDGRAGAYGADAADFNPRSPHGERRSARTSPDVTFPFQPTLPARGATLEGDSRDRGPGHFNPRSPHGERRRSMPQASRRRNFNPRSPHGERPSYFPGPSRLDLFQPTLPARGATAIPPPRSSPPRGFQPTLPARGATSSVGPRSQM